MFCVLDAQYKQNKSPEFDALILQINYAFSAIFAAELTINLFANWRERFVRNGWNWLDVAIVLLSILDFGPFSIPDWLVRLIRAFRVARLFGRVRELTKMISAITASLFPMMNAFVILVIALSICEPKPLPSCRHAALCAGSATRIRDHDHPSESGNDSTSGLSAAACRCPRARAQTRRHMD
jgi:hypothetical protein